MTRAIIALAALLSMGSSARAAEPFPTSVVADTLFEFFGCYIDSAQAGSAHDSAFVAVDHTAAIHKKALVMAHTNTWPAGAIVAAELKMCAAAGTTVPNPVQTLAVYRCIPFWDQSTTSWTEFYPDASYKTPTGWAPGIGEVGTFTAPHGRVSLPMIGAIAVPDTVTDSTWISVDITDAVRHWANGTWDNYGVVLEYPARLSSSSGLKLRKRDLVYDVVDSNWVNEGALRPMLIIHHGALGSPKIGGGESGVQ
jgi:hypothetical protein